MKKLRVLLIKSVIVTFAGIALIGCPDDSVPEIPKNEISQVKMFERDAIKTYLSYANSRLSGFSKYENGVQINGAHVYYTQNRIRCTYNNIVYEIDLDNTKGGIRAKEVEALINGVRVHSVYYQKYDDKGRLELARVDGILGQSTYISYKYEGNKIVISDGGVVELSSVDNIGNVCNVLDFGGSWLTSNYVMNPDLYFLNIYGTSVNKLPLVDDIELSEDNKQVLRVGKYTYEY